ncbi:hypothetical protein FLK61_35200 [Paenalkalicoccus suaedae]|uniref:Uncharacterized protein n=1 Tax=Paenalkalicoccus suaedae TaxID=2592382 RepID=A0A859FFN2_9BACI|nr:hypothetical protein [Paenalkalicoccus suaedae]QKS71917.1 hypothetical protein FLK61_35200 [Paenalkalicoccus suaedae]
MEEKQSTNLNNKLNVSVNILQIDLFHKVLNLTEELFEQSTPEVREEFMDKLDAILSEVEESQ